MVIISQPKSTGSRPIRDTSVLLFTIHLELFFSLFLSFNVKANLFRLPNYVSSQQGGICPLSLILSDSSQPERKRCQTSWSEKSEFKQNLLSKALEAAVCVAAFACGQASPESPLSHHTPALGSCFPATVVANPQIREREINHCHILPVKDSDSTCPEQLSQTQKRNHQSEDKKVRRRQERHNVLPLSSCP